jgi:hypothetical protein
MDRDVYRRYRVDVVTCWDCDEEFVVDETIDCHEGCDIFDGQYEEYDAWICPHCEVTNRF